MASEWEGEASEAAGDGSSDAEARARDLLRIASHDLRSPLTAIQLIVQRVERLRARGRADADLAAALARISEVVRRGLAQVDGILSADGPEAGLAAAHRAEALVDVEEVIQDAIALQREALETARCAVTVRRAPDLLRAQGPWDRHCLVRIFSNLLQNASRYAPASAIQVELARAGDRLRIAFADQGPGLPSTARFDAKRAGDGAPSGRHGLGIWIIRRGVAELKGSLKIQSAPGSGLSFAIELPDLRG